MSTPNSIPIADAIARYFAADARRDIGGIVALFTDAVVVDEGPTRRGTAEIRSWQDGAVLAYQYTTTVIDAERTGTDTYRISARLDGTFPGGAAELTFRFAVRGELISRLEIAPRAVAT